MSAKKPLSDFFGAASGKRLLQSILATPQQGLLIVSLDGIIMFANSPANQWLSTYKQGLRNQPLEDYLHNSQHDLLQQLQPHCPVSGEGYRYPAPLKLKHYNGQYQGYQLDAFGIAGEDGKLGGIELLLSMPLS